MRRRSTDAHPVSRPLNDKIRNTLNSDMYQNERQKNKLPRCFKTRSVFHISGLVAALMVCCCSGMHTGSGSDNSNYSSTPATLTYLLKSAGDRILFIEPYHGLGNRLRAYACAAALAKKSGRKIAVVWIPDVHVTAKMSDLFDVSLIPIFDEPILHHLMQLRPNTLAYDYNSPHRKDELLRDFEKHPIYVKSAYILQSQTKVSESDISAELHALRPVESVMADVYSQEISIPLQGQIIGVHIRMISNLKIDVPGIEALPDNHDAGTKAMGPVSTKRRRCHYSSFVDILDEEFMRDNSAKALVSSDSEEATTALRLKYGSRIETFTHIDNRCGGVTRRSVECLRSTLAAFIVLSRVSSSLVFSDWSSASELIKRLASRAVPHLNGCQSA